MDIKIRDKRRKKFFMVDNEILLDYNLNEYEFIFYCHLCVYERNERAYLSKTMLATQYKTSRNRWINAEKKLVKLKLIRIISKNKNNIPIYELLPVKKTVPRQNSKSKETVLRQNSDCSLSEHN